MKDALLVVDAAHLLAAAGRSVGSGARRHRAEFDVSRLLAEVLAVVPSDVRRALWVDATHPGLRTPVPRAPEGVRLDVVTLPLVGGRQRHVEAVILRDVLLDHSGSLWLVGDPRRHAVLVHTLEDSGREVTLVGISEGEPSPALRRWVRRAEVLASLRAGSVTKGGARPSYQSPLVHSSKVPKARHRDSAGAQQDAVEINRPAGRAEP